MKKIALIAVGIASALPLYAQHTSDTAEWLFSDPGQITTAATRTTRKISEAFTTVRVISQQEIRLSGVWTVQEALERLVVDLESQEGSVNRFITARGAYASSEFNERLLFLIDGIPYNDALFGTFSPMAMPVSAIERIEVAYGPGSAVYGANALAGVVNIVTKNAQSDARAGYAARGGWLSSVTFNANSLPQNSTLFVNGAFWNEPDNDRLRNNDSRAQYLHLQSVLGKEGENQWKFNYRYFNMNRGSVGMRYGVEPTPNDRLRPVSHWLTIENQSTSEQEQRSLRLYGMVGDVDFRRESPPSSGNIGEIPFNQKQIGLEWSWNQFSSHQTLTAGMDARLMSVSGPIVGSHTHNNYALFLQSEWSFGRLSPIAGARFDHHSTYGSQFSPRIGLNYAVNDEGRLRASFGRAYRAPNLQELYLNGFQVWMNVNPFGVVPLTIYGDSTLKPETVESLEFGYQQTLPNGWRTDISYFESKIHNTINLFGVDPSRPLDRVYKNTGTAKSRGWTLELNRQIHSHLEVAAAYMRVFSPAIDNDAYSSPHRATFKIALKDLKGWSGHLLMAAPATRRDDKVVGGILGFLSIHYRSNNQYDYGLRIDNLFNSPNHIASDVPGSGRAWWVYVGREW